MKQLSKISMRNITKQFKGSLALDDVSIDIYPGEIHSFAGMNGAGKSTLMKILFGVYQPTAGQIFVEGKEVTFRNPWDANGAGIAMVFQELNLFADRTIAENVLMDMFPTKYGLLQWKKAYKMCADYLHELGMDFDPRAKVSTLSLAQKQLIEIAKCTKRNPQVLIFDEPSSSLSQEEEKILYKILLSLRDKNLAIVFITHKMGEILDMADRISVLRDGKLISTGPVGDYDINTITNQMLGKSVHFEKNNNIKEFSEKDVILEARNISLPLILNDISFKLHKGEILAITGLVGSGKSELVRLLYGVNGKYSGKLYINGEKTRISNPPKAVKKGLAYLPIDRKEEGIFSNFTVKQNISVSILGELGFVLNGKKETEVSNSCKEAYGIKTSSLDAMIESLSGGNQQKVILARWFAKQSKILFLDEPTRGIDVGAKQDIYNKLREMCSGGLSFLLISSEIDEIMNVADRVIVIREGKVITEQYPCDLTNDTLLQYIMAGKVPG